MEIEPLSLAQVKRLRNGRMVEIGDDVLNVAADLRKIDRGLRLRFSEATRAFVIYHVNEDSGQEDFVFATHHLDQRIVRRIEQISAPGYDYGAELERIDREVDQEREQASREKLGDAAERLRHALRKDLGIKSRIFLS